MKFKTLLLTTITLSIILIIAFGYITVVSQAHVRAIEIVGDEFESEVFNQIVTLDFSRPMDKSIDGFIKFTPEVDFETAWQRNRLQIKIKDNLKYNQNYKLEVSDTLLDSYGKPVEPISYEFKTKDYHLFLLENQGENKIVRYNITNLTTDAIYTAEEIMDYAITDGYVVATTLNTDLSESLVAVNLENGRIATKQFATSAIHEIIGFNKSDKIIYTLQDFRIDQGLTIPISNNRAYIWDLATDEHVQLNFNSERYDISEVRLTSDDSGLLFKSSDGDFYLTNLELLAEPNATDEAIAPVGKFLAATGFDNSAEEILFVNYDPLSIESIFPYIMTFDKNREIRKLTDGNIDVTDPIFMNNSEGIIYSRIKTEMEDARGLFEIVKMDGTESESLLSSDEYSFELANITSDDKFLAVERYDTNALNDFQNQRNYGYQIKANDADVVLYDLENRTIIQTFENVILPKWQR